jgi:hypothetical protein
MLGQQSASFLALCLLLAGCAACPVGRPHQATHSREEILKVAANAAVMRGYDLPSYLEPEVSFENTRQDCEWTVYYAGTRLTMPRDFWVSVNDKTERVDVFGGM